MGKLRQAAVLSGAGWLLWSFLGGLAAAAELLDFNIAADRLDRALVRFTEQSDIQHLYTDQSIAEQSTDGVSGRYSAESALRRLLAGTALDFRFTNRRTVRIFRPSSGMTASGESDTNGTTPTNAAEAPRAREASDASERSDAAGMSEPAQRGATVPLDQITVTARKREERLQEVPISISAFSSDFIADAGMNSIHDVAEFTPNFSFRESFGRTFDRPVIRGMSNVLGGPNAGVFIDGIFVSGSISATELTNIERVEVIKGPQAALFGRSTFAGAINYVTRKPTNQFRGDATASVAERGERVFHSALTGPILDDELFFLLSARYYTYDGDFRNAGTGGGRAGGEQSWSVSASMTWEPLDRLDFTMRVAYSEDDDAHIPFRLQPSSFNNCFPESELGFFCGEVQRFDEVELNLDVLGDPGLNRDTIRSSLTANYDCGADVGDKLHARAHPHPT